MLGFRYSGLLLCDAAAAKSIYSTNSDTVTVILYRGSMAPLTVLMGLFMVLPSAMLGFILPFLRLSSPRGTWP